MFRYYSLARICYGYLRDVPTYEPDYNSDTLMDGQHQRFRESRWFQRGWTLQELIAPRSFLFVSQNWQSLGSRADFAVLLERETHIPAPVLRLEASHRQYSIAERMSWYGDRKTPRLEDEAYCLFGLFDIYMPTLYGEVKHAFRRLQEEIVKSSADTTCFIWDNIQYNYPDNVHLFAASPSSFSHQSQAITHMSPWITKQHNDGMNVVCTTSLDMIQILHADVWNEPPVWAHITTPACHD